MLIGAATAATLTVAGVAVAAAVGELPWSDGRAFERETSGSTRLVAFTLTRHFSVWPAGQTIAVWRAPQQDGTTCVFTALAEPPPTGDEGLNPAGGGMCGIDADKPPRGKALSVSISKTRGGNNFSGLISGPVDPRSGIVKLELQTPEGALPIAYDNGWFLAELGVSTSAGAFPSEGPYLLLGYDSGTTSCVSTCGTRFGSKACRISTTFKQRERPRRDGEKEPSRGRSRPSAVEPPLGSADSAAEGAVLVNCL
jgi:hypothetical protein